MITRYSYDFCLAADEPSDLIALVEAARGAKRGVGAWRHGPRPDPPAERIGHARQIPSDWRMKATCASGESATSTSRASEGGSRVAI